MPRIFSRNLSEREMQSPIEPFSFIVFGDTQSLNDVTRRIVSVALGKKPDLCIILGDLVPDGNDEEAATRCRTILEPLNQVCEARAVPGNHDYEGPHICKNFCRFFRTANEKTFTAFKKMGSRFILLDTILDSDNPSDYIGYFKSGSEQATWLKSELEDAKNLDEPVPVFAHHPIFMPKEAYPSTSPTIRLDEDQRGFSSGNLLPLLIEGAIKVYFAGHLHFYERSRYARTHFVTSGATGFEFPHFPPGGNPYSQVLLERNHLCHLLLSPEVLRCRVLDETSQLIDEWEEPLLR